MKGNIVVSVMGCRVGLPNVDNSNDDEKWLLLSSSLLLKVRGLTCYNPDTSLSQGDEEEIEIFLPSSEEIPFHHSFILF